MACFQFLGFDMRLYKCFTRLTCGVLLTLASTVGFASSNIADVIRHDDHGRVTWVKSGNVWLKAMHSADGKLISLKGALEKVAYFVRYC